MKKLFFSITLTLASVTAAEVICETVQSSIKKIRCKYMALAQETPREVTFNWISPDNEADNRSRIHKVKAGHVSVFDFRYFSGRAEGKWTISVLENTAQTSVNTEFIKDSNARVEIKSTDPILIGR